MAGTKAEAKGKTWTHRTSGKSVSIKPKKAGAAKVSAKSTGGPKKASTKPGVWVTDPFTGKKFQLILHKLPGKGKINPKVLRDAVIKVRDKRRGHATGTVSG